MSERTVRRYVTTLQELGIPVEADRGAHGGHRLRPGFRMPPLMLTTDEAVAATLALAVGRGQGPDANGPAGTALAKLVRVLPRGMSSRVEDVLAAVSTPTDSWLARGIPDPGLLATLATGTVQRRRCRVRHRPADGASTVREVDPYGLALVAGWWYVHGWCHLRRARRTFRMDRVDRVDLLDVPFRMPEGLDVAAAVERSLALARPQWPVSLLLHGPLAEVQPWVPGYLGTCEAGRPRHHAGAVLDEQPGLLRAADQRPPVRDDRRGARGPPGGVRPPGPADERDRRRAGARHRPRLSRAAQRPPGPACAAPPRTGAIPPAPVARAP